MANQENKSKYWIRKWQEKRWTYFKELVVGSIFDTAVSNHVQMANRVGDIIFWYRTDNNKKGIYFITKVVAEPKKDDAYQNSWSMSLQVIKTLVDNPVIPEKNGFKNLIEKLNKMGQGGANYNLSNDENPEKLWELVLGNEKVILDNLDIDINKKDLEIIEDIKTKNINDGKMFNPFLDMNLVRNEVRHLSFLTNLLNPNGTHHQGTLFLNLFMNRILNYESQQNNENIQKFCNEENIYVQTEKKTPNGRIDIWIENDKYIIAIEGKTETVDSKGQLNKYDDYLEQQNKPYLLIYLTMTGEDPTNNYPDNLQLMDFNDDIMTFIKESLEINTIPDKIYETLNEYYNSMITYLNQFSNTWNYELDIIDEITKDKGSYIKYENIKNNYFYNTKKYKYTVVEDVANVFEKAKAKIEREFLNELSDNLDKYFEKDGFIFSNDSNILIANFQDNINIDINNDIQVIFNKRKARSLDISQLEYNNIVELTGSVVTYINELNGETILYHIIYDSFGLNLLIEKSENENLLEREVIKIDDFSLLNSNNIYNFLDENYMTKKIKEFKLKITNGLMQIKV